jgi:voltage-gated potassium channel
MYLIEGQKAGYTSIPRSIYWAIVTLTTVGYGDITPITPLGQTISAMIMLMGYSIIAVPTGIVTSELSFYKKNKTTTVTCTICEKINLDISSIFCNKCGSKIDS